MITPLDTKYKKAAFKDKISTKNYLMGKVYTYIGKSYKVANKKWACSLEIGALIE